MKKLGVFQKGLPRVELNDKWGFINKKGEMIIQPIYNDVDDFYNGTAKVTLDGKRAEIDMQGNIISN